MVFVAALVGFSLYFNQSRTDMTIEMQQASLPVVYINIADNYVNEMHGYMEKMDVGTMKGPITPIGDNRKVTFVVEKYGKNISSLSLEVRSLDGERLIEDTPIVNYRDLTNELQTTVSLKDLIEEGKEYNVTLILELSDGRNVYYYTRVVQNEEADAADKIGFVLDFNSKTFSKADIKDLSAYLEPSREGDNTDFGNVNIHSNSNQISWGDMEPYPESQKRITLYEIGKEMASIQLKYQVLTRIDGETRHFNVTEFYRIRKGTERYHLISFDRKMSEIFVMGDNVVEETGMNLGIQEDPLEIVQCEGGDVIAFTNGGRLYSYNIAENKLARIFAFYDDSEDDIRHQYQSNNIKILNVEENGNVSFIVYGYMNRGTHEGRVGVELCYYNSLVNTIEEQVFVPYSKSYEILKCDIEKLSYFNTMGDFFLYMDGAIYNISTEKMNYKEEASNLYTDTFFVSESGNYVAWQEKENESRLSDRLMLMNLDTEEITVIGAGSERYIRPIGFMKEDLIYGICEENDVAKSIYGDTITPMYEVIIRDESGSILKEYSQENIYITEGTIEDNQITLKRTEKDPETGLYHDIEDDHITNNEEVAEGKNTVVVSTSEIFKKVYGISLKSEVDSRSLKLLTPKEVVYEGGRELELKTADDNRFIVYGDGESVGIYDNPADAVAKAYDIRGIVNDMKGNTLYKRGELADRNQIMAIEAESTTDKKNSLAVCLDNMLRLQGISRNSEYYIEKGESVYTILDENLHDAYILNLTGCDLNVTKYYVNLDLPVLAMLDNGQAYLIVGFNAQNIVLFDPESGEIYKKGNEDSRALFEENGNRFLTYSLKDTQ